MVEVTTREVDRVVERLRDRRPTVSSKYHYDERGSQLFEQITELDEYYLTRRERALLERWMPDVVGALEPGTLVELGAGSAEKSRVILDAMLERRDDATYAPIDVSGDFLRDTAAGLRREYTGLEVRPIVGDMLRSFEIADDLPGPRLVALLGSTLGNFEPPQATKLLRNVANTMTAEDRFLLGVDLRPGPTKPVEVVEAAYNDAQGVTARFSLNILNVLNACFGSDFDPDGFRHLSEYDIERGRIETSLVSLRDQTVCFPDEPPIHIAEGEAIRSEISAKYDRATVDHLFADAGLVVERWLSDQDEYYALVTGARTGL